jgi:hypothetical protein
MASDHTRNTSLSIEDPDYHLSAKAEIAYLRILRRARRAPLEWSDKISDLQGTAIRVITRQVGLGYETVLHSSSHSDSAIMKYGTKSEAKIGHEAIFAALYWVETHFSADTASNEEEEMQRWSPARVNRQK